MNQSYDLPLSEESLEELNLDETQDNTNNNEDANKLLKTAYRDSYRIPEKV